MKNEKIVALDLVLRPRSQTTTLFLCFFIYFYYVEKTRKNYLALILPHATSVRMHCAHLLKDIVLCFVQDKVFRSII